MINKYITYTFFKAAIIVLFFSAHAIAQNFNWENNTDYAITKDAVQGITNISSSIISDSFVPMTHYGSGDFTTSFVPAYFKADKINSGSELQGENIKGMAAGIGGGYALNDRLMIYGIFAGLKLNGIVYSNEYPTYKADTDYSLYSLACGMGFDIIESSNWSMPVYIGAIFQKYNFKVTPPPFTATVLSQTVTAIVNVTGDGQLYGPTAAIALSGIFLDIFRITPYYLYYRSINKPEVTAEIKARASVPFSPEIKEDYSFSVDNINASMIGFNFTYMRSDSLSFSVCAGSLLSSRSGYYNKKFLNGLEMTSIVIAITYSGNTGIQKLSEL